MTIGRLAYWATGSADTGTILRNIYFNYTSRPIGCTVLLRKQANVNDSNKTNETFLQIWPIHNEVRSRISGNSFNSGTFTLLSDQKPKYCFWFDSKETRKHIDRIPPNIFYTGTKLWQRERSLPLAGIDLCRSARLGLQDGDFDLHSVVICQNSCRPIT